MADTPKRGLFQRWFGGDQPQPTPDKTVPASPPPAAPEPAPLQPAAPQSAAPESPARESAAPVAARQPAPEPVARPAPAAPTPARDERSGEASWWERLRGGLTRTSSSLTDGISAVFTKRKLDAATLDAFEDVLVQADLGVPLAARIVDALAEGRFERDLSPDAVRGILAAEVAKVLEPVARPLIITAAKPHVILVVGVNGTGKTTTIGKLAAKLRGEGRRVMIAAGDTFRAAAIDQLRVWGERVGAPVIAREQGADAAGLVFDALQDARREGADVLLIDTAGRLQNRAELMAELEKIIRVIRRADPAAPHSVLLVLDATTGQNALAQVEIFRKTASVTGLVMTKLDGTARGGILVAIAEKHGLPVHFVGVGEGVEDLQPFQARDFARAIAGLGH